MTKVFTSQQFIDKLKWLVNDVRNKYYSGKLWLTYDKKDNKFRMDCVLSVKGILWGFNANKNDYRGGAKYCSNGVADFTCNGGLTQHCSDISQNFNKITAGEYLCMKGTKYNHTGIYLGNGKVFECTTGWEVNKCIISDIDNKGIRSYKGVKNLKWTYHGKLEYIDYSNEPDPKDEKWYQSYDWNKKYWLPKVIIGSRDYAGNKGNYMSGVRSNDLILRGYDYKKGYFLPEVSDPNDYAGNLGNWLSCIAAKSKSGRKIRYRVITQKGRTLPWVTGYDINDSKNGYAGNKSDPISCFQVEYID